GAQVHPCFRRVGHAKALAPRAGERPKQIPLAWKAERVRQADVRSEGVQFAGNGACLPDVRGGGEEVAIKSRRLRLVHGAGRSEGQVDGVEAKLRIADPRTDQPVARAGLQALDRVEREPARSALVSPVAGESD